MKGTCGARVLIKRLDGLDFWFETLNLGFQVLDFESKV